LKNKNVMFVDIQFYHSIVTDHRVLSEFLIALGVSLCPRFSPERVNVYSEPELSGHKWEYSTREEIWEEHGMECCKEALAYILSEKNRDYSITLWNTLVTFIRLFGRSNKLTDLFYGVHHYFYYHGRNERFVPTALIRMKEGKWLVDKKGNFVQPAGVRTYELREGYDFASSEGQLLCKFLGIICPSTREIWAEFVDTTAMSACGERLEVLLQNPKNLESFKVWCRSIEPEIKKEKNDPEEEEEEEKKPEEEEEEDDDDDDDDDEKNN